MKSLRFQFPFIAAAQAQKHVTHNEALEMIDGSINMVWTERQRPAAVYKVEMPNGEHSVSCRDGWLSFDLVERSLLVFLDGEWQTLISLPA